MDTTILDCGHTPSEHGPHTTGYATSRDGKKSCYECAAASELQDMNESGRATLYFVKRPDGYHVTNWTGKLDFKAYGTRKSRHNIGGTRFDFWFKVNGKEWHGYQIGGYNEIAHCKRNK